MGTVLSTLTLLVGALVTGVLSSMAANYARQANGSSGSVADGLWQKTKTFAGISMGLAIFLVLLTLFIVVKGHTGASEITGVIEEMAFGVMISFILMILAMTGIAVLDMLALIGASPGGTAFGKSVGAAVLSFGSFILSLIIIIFLL